MSRWELRWRNCSGSFGSYETKQGHFVYELTNDMMSAHVGVLRFEKGKVVAFLENMQGHHIKKKLYSFKNEEEKLTRIEQGKKWAEEEMISILSKNLKALAGE